MEREQERSGALIDVDKIIAGLPLPIPTTDGQLLLAGLGIVAGIVIAGFGRWAAKF